jgi:hypothetical protein
VFEASPSIRVACERNRARARRAWQPRMGRIMDPDNELEALVDMIYDAALNSELWAGVLTRFADAIGVPQVAMPSFDGRANVFSAIAPRLDPDLVASYREYWAFHDPILARAVLHPAGEIYTVDSFMPREEFAATPVFNEFWRPAKYGLETVGTNLLVEDELSALICFSTGPGKEPMTEMQMHMFHTLLPHLTRAVRISRQLWQEKFKHAVATEQLET